MNIQLFVKDYFHMSDFFCRFASSGLIRDKLLQITFSPFFLKNTIEFICQKKSFQSKDIFPKKQ
jgi:hypothetical protein